MITQRSRVRVLGGAGLAIAASLLLWLVIGCNEEPPASLYDESFVSGAQPVITSVNPPAGGLAGVTTITITGSNFSPTKKDNIVFFDATPATVLEASPTQLKIMAPNLVKDSIRIRIAVTGSTLFNDPPVLYKLGAAFEEVKDVANFGEPWGTTVDTSGNIYASIASQGIKKFDPSGTGSSWAPSGGFTKWSSLKLGANGMIYAVLGLKAMFTIVQGGTPQVFVRSPANPIGNVSDFDFDAQGNIWAGGNNTDVYRVAPDKSVKSYPLNATIRSVRVYSGHVYFAAFLIADSTEKILRCPITASNDLGAEEVYFNFSASAFGAGKRSVYAINFTSQGDLLLGTDGPDPIIVVHPNKSAEVFYGGLFPPTIHILAWGKGTELVAVKGTAAGGAVGSSQKIYRINAQVTGAPYYGRN